MHLADFFAPTAVNLHLRGASQDEVLQELVALLAVDDASAAALHRTLKRREALGSTGVGRGIAIPHCRSPVLERLRLAFGRHPDGLAYGAIDDQPVHFFFLIAAPPIERGNLYLPVLGRVAQFAKESDVVQRLQALQSPEEFFGLLRDKGV